MPNNSIVEGMFADLDELAGELKDAGVWDDAMEADYQGAYNAYHGHYGRNAGGTAGVIANKGQYTPPAPAPQGRPEPTSRDQEEETLLQADPIYPEDGYRMDYTHDRYPVGHPLAGGKAGKNFNALQGSTPMPPPQWPTAVQGGQPHPPSQQFYYSTDAQKVVPAPQGIRVTPMYGSDYVNERMDWPKEPKHFYSAPTMAPNEGGKKYVDRGRSRGEYGTTGSYSQRSGPDVYAVKGGAKGGIHEGQMVGLGAGMSVDSSQKLADEDLAKVKELEERTNRLLGKAKDRIADLKAGFGKLF